MKISTELRDSDGSIIATVVPQELLIESIEGLKWAINRIEELEAENARLMRLLS